MPLKKKRSTTTQVSRILQVECSELFESDTHIYVVTLPNSMNSDVESEVGSEDNDGVKLSKSSCHLILQIIFCKVF